MSYQKAEELAWLEVHAAAKEKKFSLKLLSDQYQIDLDNTSVFSLSCNIPAKESISILILHYLVKKIKGLPALTGEWISFKELEGGPGYYPVFKKRAIGPVIRKYGSSPEAIFELESRLGAKKSSLAECGVILEVFEGVPFLITVQRADEEFGPEANLLFDKNIKSIFCTEDIVVLSELVAGSI